MIVKYLILIFEEEMNNVMLGPISCSVIRNTKIITKGFMNFTVSQPYSPYTTFD